MNTTAENITFMVIRGIIALAIVGLGFYCISQGSTSSSYHAPRRSKFIYILLAWKSLRTDWGPSSLGRESRFALWVNNPLLNRSNGIEHRRTALRK